jgi:hypothetical protein
MGSPSRHFADQLRCRMSGNGNIADPGNAGLIQVVIDQGLCLLKSGASGETRILGKASGANSLATGIPVGTEVALQMGTDGGGDIVIVCATTIDGTNSTITFNDAGDYIKLRSDGTNWKLLNNLGCTLS